MLAVVDLTVLDSSNTVRSANNNTKTHLSTADTDFQTQIIKDKNEQLNGIEIKTSESFLPYSQVRF